jgi:hypothetical protein
MGWWVRGLVVGVLIAVGVLCAVAAVLCGWDWLGLAADRSACSDGLIGAVGVAQCAQVASASAYLAAGGLAAGLAGAACLWGASRL